MKNEIISIWDTRFPTKNTHFENLKLLLEESVNYIAKKVEQDASKESKLNFLNTANTMEIIPIPEPKWYRFPEYWGSEQYIRIAENVESISTRAIAYYNGELERCRLAHEANKEAIDNNIKIKDAIFELFARLNIRKESSEYTYPSSRSRTKKWITKPKEWPTEVAEFIPTKDNIQSIERTITSRLDEIAKWKDKKLKELHAKEQEEQAKVKLQESNLELARYQLKYNLPANASWDTIYYKILNSNKYLYLAHYLLKNRNDWNSGSDYAETGLSNFTVESEIDRKIEECIQYEIENFEDGRQFRDCEWNYDVIFDMVDNAELMADYEHVSKYVNQW